MCVLTYLYKISMYIFKLIYVYIHSQLHIVCSKYFLVPKLRTVKYFMQEGSGRKDPRILYFDNGFE